MQAMHLTACCWYAVTRTIRNHKTIKKKTAERERATATTKQKATLIRRSRAPQMGGGHSFKYYANTKTT